MMIVYLSGAFLLGFLIGYFVKGYRARISVEELNRALGIISEYLGSVSNDQKILNDSQKNLFEWMTLINNIKIPRA